VNVPHLAGICKDKTLFFPLQDKIFKFINIRSILLTLGNLLITVSVNHKFEKTLYAMICKTLIKETQ